MSLIIPLANQLSDYDGVACWFDGPRRLRVEVTGVERRITTFVEEYDWGVRSIGWVDGSRGFPLEQLVATTTSLAEVLMPLGVTVDSYGDFGFVNCQSGTIAAETVRMDLQAVAWSVELALNVLQDYVHGSDMDGHLSDVGASALVNVRRPGEFSDGEYRVGVDLAPGLYRVKGYSARLGAGGSIISNESVSGGWGLMRVWESDDFVEVSGVIMSVEYLPAVDPVAERFRDGTYLVGADVPMGYYQLSAPGSSAHYRLLDAEFNRIDSGYSQGRLFVEIPEHAFAIEFDGLLEPSSV